MSSSVLPLSSSKTFIVSGITFRSLIHFEFIFVYGVRKCFNFILLHVAVQFSQNYLLKRLSFLYCVVLPPFQQITIYEPPYIGVCVYLWVFYPVPLIHIPVFVPVPYCLDYCSFVVSLNSGSVIPPAPFFSQDYFDYSRFFVFPYKL